MNSAERRESPAEAIKESLYRLVRKRIEANEMTYLKRRPELRPEVLERLSPQTFDVRVFQMPPFTQPGIPLITMCVEGEPGKEDGIALTIDSAAEKEAIWGNVSPTDLKVLCEECALENIERYVALLRETPSAKLDSDYNGPHTYRSLYEMELRWAQETLTWVKRESAAHIKENIRYF